jgi:hypothetical protein
MRRRKTKLPPPGDPVPGGPVWIRWRDEWRPGKWIRTVERGRTAGMLVVEIGHARMVRRVPATAIVKRTAP